MFTSIFVVVFEFTNSVKGENESNGFEGTSIIIESVN